jgi:integrase/recombinase XerD
MNTTKLGHMTLQVVAGAVRQAVTAFLLDRRSRNLSRNTITFYSLELGYFADFLDGQGVTMLDEVTPEVIRLYLTTLAEHRNGGGCHASYRAIRALLLWAWEEYDYPGRNPITRVNPPKRKTAPLPGVTVDDVMAMVDACKDDKLALRDKAMLLTLLDTGARAFELIAWTVGDFDATTGALLIAHGKGDKERTVYVGKSTRRALLAYLRTRKDGRDYFPLFATRDGEHFTVQGLRRVVEKRAEQAGVKVPALHDFRRAFCLNMLRNGVPVPSLQLLMGHSDVQTTVRYLALTDNDLRGAHFRGSPVEKAKR